MNVTFNLSKNELLTNQAILLEKYNKLKKENISLDISRGKPCTEQLNLSNKFLNKPKNYITKEGIDIRNYGFLDGLPEAKSLFSKLLDIPENQIIVCGNSSLNLMYDCLSKLFLFGSHHNTPWSNLEKVKFLCPTPGYDRHFDMLEEFGIEMISVPMLNDDLDIEQIETLVSSDKNIKGIFCVPLYSNPSGCCYSNHTVERLVKMNTKALDFKIFWDNAYGIHHLIKENKLENILSISKQFNTDDRILYFFSTSKITFAGAGVAILASSEKNILHLKNRMKVQIISYDKINQQRLVENFQDVTAIKSHMKDISEILKPKFDLVLKILENEFPDKSILNWTNPQGGYFICVETFEGCAKEIVELSKKIGLILTPAGSTFPYKKDEKDNTLRLAPSFPSMPELKKAMEAFSICVKLSTINQLLKKIGDY